MWDMKRQTQLRTIEPHGQSPITGMCVLEAASGSLPRDDVPRESGVTFSSFISGDRVLVVKPTNDRVVGFCVATEDAQPTLYCSTSDNILRKWQLSGVGCTIGNCHPVASMMWPELRAWLHDRGLGAAETSIDGMMASELFMAADLASLLGAERPEVVSRLQKEIDGIRKQMHKETQSAAIDDFTITRSAFASFTTEKLQEWLDECGLHPISLLVYASKCKASALLEMKSLQIMGVGSCDYEQLVHLLHDEMLIVRSKLRESFAEKSVEEVAAWAKPKHPLLQFVILVSGFNGIQLLDHTKFDFSMTVLCPECHHTVTDPASVCPVTGRDHARLPQSYDAETRVHVDSLVSHIREAHADLAGQLQQKLDALPVGIFSDGVYWYDLLHEEGSLAPMTFNVPELQPSPSLVINSAKLRLYVTGYRNPRMVCITERSQGTLLGLTALQVAVTKYVATGQETPIPNGWKKTAPKHSGDSYVFEYGPHSQVAHPCAPRAEKVGISGSTLTAVAKMQKPPAEVEVAVPPKPQHFFEIHDENTDAPYVEAEVSQQLMALIQRKDKYYTFLVVAEEAPDEICAPLHLVRRPELWVSYYYSDQLCGCTAQLKYSALCDRFCNVNSTCTGHSCTYGSTKCRRAPYMVWQSPLKQGGEFDGLKLDKIANLSRTNRQHIEKLQSQRAARNTVGTPSTLRLSDVFDQQGANPATVTNTSFVQLRRRSVGGE